MNLTEKEIKTVKDMMEELRIYRNEDEGQREMANDGLYDNEIALANKLGIVIKSDDEKYSQAGKELDVCQVCGGEIDPHGFYEEDKKMSMPFQKKECVVCVTFDDLDDFIQSKRSEEECRYGLHVERCGDGLDLFYYDEDDCKGKCPYSVINGFDIIMDVLSEVVGFRPAEVAFNRNMVYLIK